MRLETVAHGGSPQPPTVYTVLAQSARSHSRRYLAVEALLAGTAAGLIVVWQLSWWPVASLAMALSLYAAWGLVAWWRAGGDRTPWIRFVAMFLAGLATVATLAGFGGLALKAFWGDAPGPYGTCYHADGTSYACRTDGSRRPVSRPPD